MHALWLVVDYIQDCRDILDSEVLLGRWMVHVHPGIHLDPSPTIRQLTFWTNADADLSPRDPSTNMMMMIGSDEGTLLAIDKAAVKERVVRVVKSTARVG